MAASRRSPLMRDQWRAEDDHRDSARRRERGTHDRRPLSPAAARREKDIEGGLKIKGRAVADLAADSQSRNQKEHRKEEAVRDTGRGSRRTPEGRGAEAERRNKGPRESSRELVSEHPRHRHKPDLGKKRRRTRSRSAELDLSNFRDERRRHRSPVYSGRTDSFRPRSRSRNRSRRRGRPPSPQRPTRGDHYSSSYPEASGLGGRFADTYVPGSSRRLSPPAYREPSSRRRSRSNSRYDSRLRKGSPPYRRLPSQDRTSRKDREFKGSLYHSRPHPKDVSRGHKDRERHREESPLSSRPGPRGHARRRHPSSQSPVERKVSRRIHTNMQQSPTRPIQSIVGDGSRAPSQLQRIPSFDTVQGHSNNANERFAMHGMNTGDPHSAHRHPRPPHLNTQHSHTTSPQWTPTSSHHGSPHSGSPFSQGRGGWNAQLQQYQGQTGTNAYTPPYRQGSYPPQQSPQAQYYPNGQQSPYGPPQHMQSSYQNQSFRGGHSGYRGNHYAQASDRRFSGSGGPPSNYQGPAPTRGRGGHFQNLQWTASNSSSNRGRGDSNQASSTHRGQSSPPTQPAVSTQGADDDNPFRPPKDLRVEDPTEKDAKMPPPVRQGSDSSSKEGSKFSFAFSKKPAASAPTKPPPDLTQRKREPPKKENLLESSSAKPVMRPTDSRYERDRREDRRGRDLKEDRPDYRDRHERREPREYRNDRRPEREPRRGRAREPSPPAMVKKIMKRIKPRPTLPTEFAESTSVYYRKPGNESVVGSGTYGKVFKAIHVYTKNLAALKKIRMDGEKDGFPVTAVREIKLLQSLKHENVVALQEVMVEHNDCFMVFEYLSHDLTGLLNHPTFKLEHAHKKHLAQQLFEGLNYLHRRSVLHRDIKAANILVSNTGQLKLADFGLARFFAKRGKPDYTNRVITIWYRSPELLLGETQYGPAVDIWSAACVMIEIFTRHAIFPGDGGEINQLDKIYNVLGTPTRSEWPGLVDMAWFELLRPTERKPNTFAEKYQERVTPDAFELLQAMFMYDPLKRPTAGDVLEHPYFRTEDPAPRQAIELKDLEGDWHEFESKALRKENERKNQEARRASRLEEQEREKAKRRASVSMTEREAKRPRTSSGHDEIG